MHLEKLDDAFRRASWKKNQGLAFACMLFRKGKPELQEAENVRPSSGKCAMPSHV